MENYKITAQEILQNNVKSAADRLDGTPQENKNVFDRLPELIASKLNAFVEYVFGSVYTKDRVDEIVDKKVDSAVVYKKEEVYTKAETDSRINAAVFDSGSADMQKTVYDSDNDGIVEYADSAMVAEDAQKLNGNTADYYATAQQVDAVQMTAEEAYNTANNAMPKSGGEFTGEVVLSGNPTSNMHAATKEYADGKMAIAGGTFTGNVVAYSSNRTTASVRNVEVRTSSATGTLQSTNKIIMVRK